MSFTRSIRAHTSHRMVPITVVLCLLMITVVGTSAAQCLANPTGETAVGLRNVSIHFLTFYIDGANRGGVPSGDRSIDFIVPAGEHVLRADAVIDGETVSASRSATIPAGHVCTWTVTDPPAKPAQARKVVRFALAFPRVTATVPLVFLITS